MPSNWRSPPRPAKKLVEQGRPYNRCTGKVAEDERVADGFAVAMNRVMTGERRSPSANDLPTTREARVR